MLESLIFSLCVGSAPCTNAAMAAAIQTGVKANVGLLQHKTNEIAVATTKKNLPPEVIALSGSGAYVIKTIQKKEIAFRLPTAGVCDNISSVVGLNIYTVKLEWKL